MRPPLPNLNASKLAQYTSELRGGHACKVSFPQVLSSRLDTLGRVLPVLNSERHWHTVIDKQNLASFPNAKHQ